MSADAFDVAMKAAFKRWRQIGPIGLFSALFVAILVVWSWWATGTIGLPSLFGIISGDERAAASPIVISGAWGDSFGGFNALFGALGFVAVASTLFLQFRALEEQKKDQHLQRFEATFFELIKLMRELRSELEFVQSTPMKALRHKKYVRQGKQTGFNAVKFAVYEVRHWILATGRNSDGKYEKDTVAKHYDASVHSRYESRFAPYFRIIYTILHKIRQDNELSDEQKVYYGNILRSQLTSYEITLLAMNATSSVSKDLFDLVRYFRMLKYLPVVRVRGIMEDIFPTEAFSSRDDGL